MAAELSELHSDDEAIRTRVLHAIAANRNPGLHFIGHFLNPEWQSISGGSARSVLHEGPHCRDANQAINLAVLGTFIDHSLAASVRTGTDTPPPGARLGTIHMEAQFTGVPVVGDLEADSLLLSRSEGVTLRQSLASATIRSGNKPVCHMSATYAQLSAPPGVTLAPLPWEREEAQPVVPVGASELEPKELAILKSCDAGLRKASPHASFIQHFLGCLPRRTLHGASSHVPIRPQISNRVGHVQGGILFGLTATTACAAVPPTMMLWNLSVFFLTPGHGSALTIRSRLLYRGRTLAVVRTEIKNANGGLVLEAISDHVTQKRD